MLANLEIVPVHALPTDLALERIFDQRRSLATASSGVDPKVRPLKG